MIKDWATPIENSATEIEKESGKVMFLWKAVLFFKNIVQNIIPTNNNKTEKNNSWFTCTDWEKILKFITESVINIEWKKFTRVEWENNNFFYIFSTDEYETIEKFHIEENWKKELVTSMYNWLIINYNWKEYTRIETIGSWTFYIDTKTDEKLYHNDKLVNFLKEKKSWEFQIDTY